MRWHAEGDCPSGRFSMKYYLPVLVVVRFLAVSVVVYAVYRCLGALIGFQVSAMGDGSYAKMMKMGRDAYVNHGLMLFGMGTGLFLLAPWLARLITWGLDSNHR